jgi:starch-binding outer membrane protein, SusD/RagB family
MMNTMKKLSFMIVLAAGLLFAGCNDLLEDVDPSTSISPEEALGTPDGVELLRNALYSEMRASASFTTQNLLGPSALADETYTRVGASRYDALNFATGTSGTAHIGSYGAAYNIIQIANQLINDIDPDAVDSGLREQVVGEAYAVRAYAYHMLVKVYGYEPGNYDIGPESNWNLGVPIFTESVFSVEDADTRPRSTVEEVYNQISDDLDEAETRLVGVNNPTIANEMFVEGLRARVELFSGNWGDAATAAQNAIDLSPALAEDEDDIVEMFNENEAAHPEAMFLLEVDPNTEPIAGSNVNEGPAAYTADQWVAQLPTQFVLDLFDADDYRNGWFKLCGESGCDNANDLEVASTKYNGDKGNLADDLPFMRVSEMYLILAEASAKDANAVTPEAVDALQELKDARNAGPIPAAALVDVDSFEDEVMDERVRELHMEGHRFWDLKRTGNHIPDPITGDIKIRFDSYRILAPIGNNNLNANSELEENPNY